MPKIIISCFKCKHYQRDEYEYPCEDCNHNKNAEGLVDYYDEED